jgi:ribonuclease HII
LPGVGIGVCDQATIDRINILEAAFLAMKKALSALRRKPELVLVDGKFIIPNLSLAQKAIVDGDALCFAIAAASIVAKEARDRLMGDAHTKYPTYGFDRHKGYGTQAHLAALRAYGPCPLHRRSFAPVREALGIARNAATTYN